MFHGPPPGARFQYTKITPPKNIADVPRYLRELLSGFFTRMGYVCKLVWNTGHWILFSMLFFSVFQGLMPVIGSKISEAVLNELQAQYGQSDQSFAAFLGTTAFFLLVFMFVYNILNSILNTLRNTVIRIAGELVVRTVKLEIMNKAKTLDLCSFDLPAFYEKLENANREAGMRPIQILSSTFSVISAAITLRENGHMRITAFDERLSKKTLKALDLFADAFLLLFACFMIKEGLNLAKITSMSILPGLRIKSSYLYSATWVSGIVYIIAVLENIWRLLTGREMPKPPVETGSAD